MPTRYTTRPTRDLKPGDMVVDFFEDEATARDAIEDAEAGLMHDLCPEPATPEDIAEAEQWPVAVVEEKE